MQTEVSTETILLLVKFRIFEVLRYLSHAERVTMFQRGFVRAGIEIKYSSGFNPRPKLSLPLPGCVGVESDGDLACIHIYASKECVGLKCIQQQISNQMPQGCEIIDIEVCGDKKTPIAEQVSYIFDLKTEIADQINIQAAASQLLAKDNLVVKRFKDKDSVKEVDIRKYLKNIEFTEGTVKVDCKITPKGSVRVDEVMGILGLEFGMLKSPVRRTDIKWSYSKTA